MTINSGFVIVTGASSGIGQAAAKLFSQQGYNLLLLARRVDSLIALDLPNTICECTDITNLDAVRKSIEKARQKFGKINCLINNAGILFSDEIQNLSPTRLSKMLETNIVGAYNCIHCVVDEMKASNTGTIINVGSIASKKAVSLVAGYCASKFGMFGLSESLRIELAKYNVRVLSILPGYVETELYDDIDNKEIKSMYDAWKQQIKEILAPIDVARAMLFSYQQPQHVSLREIVISPTKQEL